ncbi:MAG: AAA family ATPase, partial [Bacteroidota bacterium]
DLRLFKSQFSNHLQRQYKKQDDYWYMDLIEPRLKVLEIKIRPTYKDDTGSYPTNTILKIPVPVIYGETDQGHYECYLPLLDESFYYYDPKQFRSLVQYIAVDLFNQLSPEQLNRHLLYPPPQLDIVSLKVNDERELRRGQKTYQRQYDLLNRLTVKYPYPKALRKQLNTFPEAAWELEKQVGEVVDKLLNIRANILVVGKHGVGKSSVLQQAIKKVNSLSKKEGLDMSFWQLMSQRITASARYLGEWQENVEKLIEELRSANGVLWVVDIIRLLQSGGQGAEDSVAAFLVSFLQQDRIQLIGEVTQQELESMRRLLPGFVEHFQLVQVEELSEQKIQSILTRIAEYASQQLNIQIASVALQDAYRLLARYYPYESFPGKAIKFLGRCVSEAQLLERKEVSRADVVRNFIEQTGLPELFLRDDLLLDQKELSSYFDSRIIGQPEAVGKLSGIVKIFKAGLNNPDKPISTMIFAGPTGVGKTASAKALADYFFGKGQKRNPLIRIDMSEFQHPSQISRFIGAGKEVGKLAQEIRERPFAVVLLDEVEKASPAIFDAFLTVLDEGILVDAFGRITNFRNTIIVMTSNLGASNRASIGFKNMNSDESKYLSAISSFFRPEFVNRIDHVVMFNALSKEDIEKITLKELEALRKREGFVKKGLSIEFGQTLIDHLSDIGFDERYGARPLQRAIEQTVVNPMANWLLLHPEAEQRVLKIDWQGGVVIE